MSFSECWKIGEEYLLELYNGRDQLYHNFECEGRDLEQGRDEGLRPKKRDTPRYMTHRGSLAHPSQSP